MHCPSLISKKAMNCEFADAKDDGLLGVNEVEEKRLLRQQFDMELAEMNLQLYRLSEVDIAGVWGLCAEAEHALVNNKGITKECFLSGVIPIYSLKKHPAYNVRKLFGAIDLVAGNDTVEKTRPKRPDESQFQKLSSISRDDERLLVYRIYEPYFDSLFSFVKSDISKKDVFVFLETSKRFKCLFTLEYSALISDSKFKAMTTRVVALAKQDSRVKSAMNKV